MYDSGKVITGLVVFVAVALFPFWYAAANDSRDFKLKLEKPKGEACVEDAAWMRAWHMDMLDEWRDVVVREGMRYYVSSDGVRHSASLSLECLRCHQSKAKFCDQCHNYVGVSPYCWDCHVQPEGER